MSTSLADLSLLETAARLRTGEITPSEVLEACLARIDSIPELGAFVALDVDGARRAADQPQPAPLYGVPLAVKDLVDVAGLPTRAGTRALHDASPAAADSAVIGGMRARGAIPVGKVATDELASSVIGPGVGNPLRPDRIAGGSSGGSAAAVAAGATPLALGTDTAGSVRIPAACCGICGLIGRNRDLPMAGVIALSESLDTLGVLVREPGDLSLAWHALSGRAPQPRPLSSVVVCADEVLGGVNEAELAAGALAVERLALPLRELRTEPFHDWAFPRATIINDEALRAHRAAGLYPPRDPAHAVSDAIRESDERAEQLPASEVNEARAWLAELGTALRTAVGEGSVLVLPALPVAPPPRTSTNAAVIGDLTRLVAPMNIAGLACAVVPIDGVGVQLAARDEDTVLAAVARLTR
jgi:aspartyl-tRNA(Asn)/glutamyl-tRNA(Gln) amidotransferase subunit A